MFLNYYETASALVINSYRQMAWGNIRLALEKGVKIYLNEKNIHKDFLINNEFKIFSIEDFENDLKNDSLGFNYEVSMHNLEQFEIFSKSYTKDHFQKKILENWNEKKSQ